MSDLLSVSSDVFSLICRHLLLRDKALQLTHLGTRCHPLTPACFAGEALSLTPATLDAAERHRLAAAPQPAGAGSVEWLMGGVHALVLSECSPALLQRFLAFVQPPSTVDPAQLSPPARLHSLIVDVEETGDDEDSEDEEELSTPAIGCAGRLRWLLCCMRSHLRIRCSPP